MDLETEVGRAAFSVALLARALHDPAQWTMTWAGQTVPVERVRLAQAVTLIGMFHPACHLGQPDPVVTVWSGDDLLFVRPLGVHPGDAGFTFQVTLGVAHHEIEANAA